MRRVPASRALAVLGLALLAGLSGCSRMQRLTEEDCMTRVMYFESNRTSREGMVAVGTVVMNRKNSGKYPKSVCGVVGQKKQFAPGVLSKPMAQGKDLARKTAREVLRGARHREVGSKALFFHTAGFSYPYNNMHYVAIAGGNAFYEKRRHPTQTQAEVAARGDRLSFDPPSRVAARRDAIDARINADSYPPDMAAPVYRPGGTVQGVPAEAVPIGPAQTLATMSEAPLPEKTVEQILSGDGLY